MANNRNDEPDLTHVVQSPCDLNLLICFVLSCLLFAVGFKITFFSDLDDEDSVGSRWPWLGPLFLFSGTILALNTLNYLRNKNLTQMSSEGSDTDLFEATTEPVEIRTNNTAPYQNLPPSYTSTLHSDNNYRNYTSLPLNESDSFAPGELSSSNQTGNRTNYGTVFGSNSQATNPVHNTVHNAIHNPAHNPLHTPNSLNSFDHGDRPANERGQYHPLTVDLPPAYNDIIK